MSVQVSIHLYPEDPAPRARVRGGARWIELGSAGVFIPADDGEALIVLGRLRAAVDELRDGVLEGRKNA